MMNVCLFQRKQVPLQISKRRRSQNLFYVVCTSVTRGEGRGGECSPPLILYIDVFGLTNTTIATMPIIAYMLPNIKNIIFHFIMLLFGNTR